MDRLIESVTGAWERMFDLLFRPFVAARYALLGLFAFFASCTDPSLNVNTDLSGVPFPGNGASTEELLIYTGGVVFFLGIVLVFLVFAVTVWGALLFVSSRFTMMLIEGMVTGKPEIEGWSRHAEASNALFRFRFVLGVSLSVVLALAVVFVAVSQMGVGLGSGDVDLAELAGALTSFGSVVFLLLLTFLVFALDRVAVDLAAPVLYVEQGGVLGTLGKLQSAERFAGPELLAYVVVRLLIGFATWLLTLPVQCFCCCLMMIPGVSALLLLPVTVFLRGLSLQWIGRLDDRYQVLLGEPIGAPRPL